MAFVTGFNGKRLLSSSRLALLEHPPTPARGLVLLHNRRGKPFSERDIHRWIRLNRSQHGAEKIDLLTYGPVPAFLTGVLDFVADPQVDLAVRLSLRTGCDTPPPDLAGLRDHGLHDVMLCPDEIADDRIDAWLDACAAAGLPLRLCLPLDQLDRVDGRIQPEAWAARGVRVVQWVLEDPFRWRPARPVPANLGDRFAGLAPAFTAAGIDVSVEGVPFCALPEAAWPHVINGPQLDLDHHQYTRQALDLALLLYKNRPHIVARALLLHLGRAMSYESPIDHGLLRRLLEDKPRWYRIALALRKITRYLPWPREASGEPASNEAAWEAALSSRRAEEEHRLGPACSACRLRRVCSRVTPAVRRYMPGFRPVKQEGDLVADPLQFALHRPRYVDAVDAVRCDLPRLMETLAAHARQVVDNTPPTHAFGRYHYKAENTYCLQHPGAVRWFSLTAEEKRSTGIGTFHAPCTMAVMVGGGIARYAGFALGRHSRMVCPMEVFSHRLVLHVDAQGHYVLLRDGAVVRPSQPGGPTYAPALLPTVIKPKLSLWDIDGSIFTQNLLVWEEPPGETSAREPAEISIIITSVRFTRRLQAVLLSIAHQQGIDLRRVEVIVAYVPGLDATDDLISAMAAAHPELRIVRSPFPERYAKSKGFVLNESIDLASGRWVMLLDSDILLPVDMLARIAAVSDDVPYIGPDRRKMLTPETTGRVLLGERTPWEHWDELVQSPGEERVKEAHVPVGFCQCVNARCLREVRYPEYDHFEGADWDFMVAIHDTFGEGLWLEETAVLHLDHGGSQWYGTHRHL